MRWRSALIRDEHLFVSGLGLAPLCALASDPATALVLCLCFVSILGCTYALCLAAKDFVGAAFSLPYLLLVSGIVTSAMMSIAKLVSFSAYTRIELYIAVMAMNSLLIDLSEKAVTDEICGSDTPLLDRGRRHRAYFVNVATTVIVIVMFVATIRLVLERGFSLIVAGAPRGLLYFGEPGGALIVLGIVLAIFRWGGKSAS